MFVNTVYILNRVLFNDIVVGQHHIIIITSGRLNIILHDHRSFDIIINRFPYSFFFFNYLLLENETISCIMYTSLSLQRLFVRREFRIRFLNSATKTELLFKLQLRFIGNVFKCLILSHMLLE